MRLSYRDFIVASGVDTATFLHAMLSQDIVAMVDGDVRWAFLLTPQGKVVSHFRVHRMRADEFLLDVDAGQGGPLRAALSRYLIRTKCALTITEHVPMITATTSSLADLPQESVRVLPAHPLYQKDGVQLVDVFGVSASVLESAGVRVGPRGEEVRIRAGFPLVGVDLDDTSVPNGTGLLPWAVSFGKGCYVGQELVERIDSRAATVPSRLAHLSAARQPEPTGDKAERAPIRVTSGAALPNGSWIGLGWVSRTLAEGAEDPNGSGVTVGADVGSQAASQTNETA